MAIAAAGPCFDGAISLTNAPWRVVRAELAKRFGGIPVQVMNDLVASAHALRILAPDAMVPVGDPLPAPVAWAGKLAINVGTGFGAAVLLDRDDGPLALASEAGHMTLPDRGSDGLDRARRAGTRFCVVEDVLSGPGLARLHAALGHGAHTGAATSSSSEIFDPRESDEAAHEALRLFTELLATVVGDLVLAHAAWCGVYFCGSVARAWHGVGDATQFREAFSDKGKMSELMARVPVVCLVEDDVVLAGLAACVGPAGVGRASA